MALFKVVNNQAQLDAGEAASTDVYGAGIRFTQDGAARTTRFAGTLFNQGIPMSPTGQVAIVDATSGLPVDAIYLNGLPISGNKVCVSLNASSVISSGLPFDSNGVLVGSLSGFTTLALDFTGSTTLDPRITFSRTSNATLTDSTGKIAYAPHNLVTNSEDFEAAAWVKQQVTVSSNVAVAPNGTTTADKLAEDNTAAVHRTYQSVAKSTDPITYNYSIYVKAAERTTASVFIQDGTVFARADIDLSTGALSGIVGSALATDAGNGWWRVSVAGLSGANATVLGMVASNSFNSFTGTTGSGIFIWGAELNVGALQSYNSTTPKNLLGFTQEFDNAAWVKGAGVSVSANATTAPDGFATADNVTFTSGGAAEFLRFSVTMTVGTIYVLSVYAKLISGTPGLNFDYGNTGSSSTFTPTSEWQRFSFPFTFSGANNWIDIQATAGGTIAFWGAQLSNSASVDAYVYNPQAAPTSTAYFGPRFDYSPTTLAANGLLIEQQSTNLFTYSEQLDDASWTKLGGSITANATTDPSGANGADRLTEDTSTGLHIVYRSVSVTSGTTYTMSYWAKRGSGTRNLSIRMDNGTSTLRSTVDLATGVITPNASHTVTARAWGSYWYVTCAVTATASTFVVMGAEITTTGGLVTYTGDGTSSLDLWGFQLEAGSFATSYIPTVASQVTRAADNASMLGDNFATWYNASEGTLFAKYSVVGYNTGASNAAASFNDSTTSNFIVVRTTASTTQPNFSVRTSGVTESLDVSTTIPVNTTVNAAGAYKINDFAFSANGSAVVTDTSGSVPVVSRFSLGFTGTIGTNQLNGTIRSISYYPTRLANATLQSITT